MSTKLFYKSYEIKRRLEPSEMGLEHTSAERIELKGERDIESGSEEVCLVCLGGEFNYICSGENGTAVIKDMLYIPCKTTVTVSSEKSAVIMRYGAPSDLDSKFAHIKFTDVDRDKKRHNIYGKKENNSLRNVWDYIDDSFPATRLLVGMCEGEQGGWTAWPPHEHAEKREEVYVYFNMDEAFGIQCVYEDMDNPLVVAMVRNGDLVSVPKGYHPSVGCPAGRISYIYCMVSKKAGDRRFMDLNVQKIYGNKFE